MNTVFKILGAFILLIVAYAVTAMLAFSNDYRYEKYVVLNAPEEKVWLQVSSMKAFNRWNPWMKLDKDMNEHYGYRKSRAGGR